MSGHAALAPSDAGRWSHCAASISLSRQVTLTEDEDDGAEGTAAHAVASALLLGQPAPQVAPNGVVVTPDMIAAVKPYVDFVRSWPTQPMVETAVRAPSIHSMVWGTPDAYTLDYKINVARIADLKYGFGLVEVYRNPQLLCYAAGLMDVVGPEAIDWSFELTIVQPRVWHPSGPVRTWRLSAAELRNHVRHLRSMAEEAMANDPSSHVGAWCRHCEARSICGALRSASLDAAEQAGDATPVAMPNDALGQEIALLRRAQGALSARLDGLEADAIARINAGAVVSGWRVERPPGREEWTKPASEVMALGDLFGVALAKEAAAVTPNQARKAGIPPEMVAAMSARKPGTPKLTSISTTDAQRVFGKQGA